MRGPAPPRKGTRRRGIASSFGSWLSWARAFRHCSFAPPGFPGFAIIIGKLAMYSIVRGERERYMLGISVSGWNERSHATKSRVRERRESAASRSTKRLVMFL